jgi:hypothetical protein
MSEQKMNADIMRRLIAVVAEARQAGCLIVASVIPKTVDEYEACQGGMQNSMFVPVPPATVEHRVWEGVVLYRPRR